MSGRRAQPRLVVAGASLAGLRAAEAARRHGHRGPIVLVGDEPHHPYDRPPLSKQVLVGRVEPAATALDVAAGLDAEWRLGVAAVSLDLDGRRLHLDDGSVESWDGLVVATGARPRVLDTLPALEGVHTYRTLDDAVAVRRRLVAGGRLVVVGAGFIGLEVAASARALGSEVTVVEAAGRPLSRALDDRLGAVVAEWHRSEGVELLLDTTVAGLADDGRGRVAGVIVEGAEGTRTLPADVVVVGVGVTPATGWLESSGVDLDDGVRTDRDLRVLAGGSALADVVAAGDVARVDDGAGGTVRREHWTSAADQAVVAAVTLLGASGLRPQGGVPREAVAAAAAARATVPYVWSDQYGKKLQVLGDLRPGDEAVLVDGSYEERRFVVAYGRDGRLVGAVGLARPGRVMALQRAIAAGGSFPPPTA